MATAAPQRHTALQFLGVGDASQQGLGHASAVVELGTKRLLIDCGPGVLDAFMQRYEGCMPDALFITHCHLDHIADFEKLFIKCWFKQPRQPCQVFVPAAIIPLLHERVGTYPGALAEGGCNFWDAFQLIPVSAEFIFSSTTFKVTPARHHGVGSAYSLYLPGQFFYSGDTRPIPEILEHSISKDTVIFHDCSVIGNPSHSGIDDILREYSATVLERMWVYHYHSALDREQFTKVHLRVVAPQQRFELERPTHSGNE